jgi:hypothetical protein
MYKGAIIEPFIHNDFELEQVFRRHRWCQVTLSKNNHYVVVVRDVSSVVSYRLF